MALGSTKAATAQPYPKPNPDPNPTPNTYPSPPTDPAQVILANTEPSTVPNTPSHRAHIHPSPHAMSHPPQRPPCEPPRTFRTTLDAPVPPQGHPHHARQRVHVRRDEDPLDVEGEGGRAREQIRPRTQALAGQGRHQRLWLQLERIRLGRRQERAQHHYTHVRLDRCPNSPECAEGWERDLHPHQAQNRVRGATRR